MSEYLSIKTSVIQWACERMGMLYPELASKKEFNNLNKEENGIVKLTMKQLKSLASQLRYPLAYFMLDEPVTDIDTLSINDFRTQKSTRVKTSISLREQVDYCKRQQEWFSDYVRSNDFDSFKYINHFRLNDNPVDAGITIKEHLNINYIFSKNEVDYLTAIKRTLENKLILVITSKVLKQTTHRLDTAEFRGFALTDKYAPLIFVNGNDSPRAQIFTICHELGHICLGLSGVSDISLYNTQKTEKWCNEFAANILMPKDDITVDFNESLGIQDFLKNANKKYHISNEALLVRIYKLHLIKKDLFLKEIKKEEQNYLEKQKKDDKDASGGNYYNNVGSRLSKLLTNALISSTAVGETTLRDATYLLGLKSISVFDRLSRKLGENK